MRRVARFSGSPWEFERLTSILVNKRTTKDKGVSKELKIDELIRNKCRQGVRAKRLDEVATIYSGDTPRAKEKSYWDGPISWITPKDVSNGKMFIEHGERSITQEGFDSCSAKMIPKGSVLMTSRAPVGNVAIAKKKLCTNQGMKSLVLNDDQDTRYWYHALVHAKRRIQDASTTGTFSEISKTAFSRLEFHAPPPY